MTQTIPYLTEEIIKVDYAKIITERLGSSSEWKIDPASMTSGLIASPRDKNVELVDGILRIYILGIPPGSREEERGIGIMHYLKPDAPFKLELNKKGYQDVHPGSYVHSILKPLNLTDEVVAELKSLERLLLDL